ncbi:hypothetical protein ACFQFR_03760 [Streptomyces goshikiensis]
MEVEVALYGKAGDHTRRTQNENQQECPEAAEVAGEAQSHAGREASLSLRS